jgi:hypothetical protein
MYAIGQQIALAQERDLPKPVDRADRYALARLQLLADQNELLAAQCELLTEIRDRLPAAEQAAGEAAPAPAPAPADQAEEQGTGEVELQLREPEQPAAPKTPARKATGRAAKSSSRKNGS